MTEMTINITLTDDELEFLQWLAECDGLSKESELKALSKISLRETMREYKSERSK